MDKRFMNLVLKILLAIWGDVVTSNNSSFTKLQHPHKGNLHTEAWEFINEGE